MPEQILIVDDEAEIADLIELYLKNENYAVHKFYTAREALACAETEQLDLAILDIMLPDMSGFDLCRRIREKHTVSRDHAHRQGWGNGQDHGAHAGCGRLYH